MPDERWSEISRVCHEALQRDGAERTAYLEAACGSDADLRSQVEGLLQQEGRADGFLSAPAWEDAARVGAAARTPGAAPEAGRTHLVAGARLGHYEVLDFVGAGGMGEVYRARDTRLDRIVALKRLPPVRPGDAAAPTLPEPRGSVQARENASAERAARFAREGKALAQLNHPNICTLYDIAAEDGTMVLVMEYLDGETLAARLRKRPLPIAVACEIGARIADALAAAHTLGIVHRDLKPSNVMLLADSGGSAVPRVKLLDFGLAKLRGRDEVPTVATGDERPSDSVSARGVVVGTPAYSSPEQLQGEPADGRTDIWALGMILYEMLAGRPAFGGDSAVSLMTRILESEAAPLSTVLSSVPPALDRLVARCLAKAPGERWQAAADVAAELRWVAGQAAPSTSVKRVRTAFRRRKAVGWALAAAAVLLVAAAATWWRALRPESPAMAGIGLEVRPAEQVDAGGWGTLPRQVPTPGGSRTALAWTRDGRALVFVGRQGDTRQLYVRALETAAARPLSGTEGAQAPAVSPDGQWVAFWANKKVRKLPLAGGPVVDLMPGPDVPPFGMSWGANGDLYVGHEDGRIWVIRPDGGRGAVTSVAEHELSHVLPSPLPGGRTILYTVRRRTWTWGDEEIVAQALADGTRKVLLEDAADARYVEGGFLVFLRRGQLMAVRFDADRLELRGLPVVVLDPVAQSLTAPNPRDITGAGQYAVSPAGTLAWIRGSTAASAGRVIVSVDRQGRISPLAAPVRDYIGVRASPDGRKLAMQVLNVDGMGISVFDVERGTLSPLVQQGESSFPRWSADGREILFAWRDHGRGSLAWLRADSDGTMRPREFVAVPNVKLGSIGRDGRVLALRDDRQIVTVSVENGRPHVEPLDDGGRPEAWPALSPDGGWVVYGSDGEVWVRPFPGPGPAVAVSVGGGRDPVWNPTGREIFYAVRIAGGVRGRMMAVDFTAANPPRIGRPKSLFDFQEDLWFLCTTIACYDAAPDGQRFYAIQTRLPQPTHPPVTHINVVPRWVRGLSARVPAR